LACTTAFSFPSPAFFFPFALLGVLDLPMIDVPALRRSSSEADQFGLRSGDRLKICAERLRVVRYPQQMEDGQRMFRQCPEVNLGTARWSFVLREDSFPLYLQLCKGGGLSSIPVSSSCPADYSGRKQPQRRSGANRLRRLQGLMVLFMPSLRFLSVFRAAASSCNSGETTKARNRSAVEYMIIHWLQGLCLAQQHAVSFRTFRLPPV
jgi:hypothetical protein